MACPSMQASCCHRWTSCAGERPLAALAMPRPLLHSLPAAAAQRGAACVTCIASRALHRQPSSAHARQLQPAHLAPRTPMFLAPQGVRLLARHRVRPAVPGVLAGAARLGRRHVGAHRPARHSPAHSLRPGRRKRCVRVCCPTVCLLLQFNFYPVWHVCKPTCDKRSEKNGG